jgi:spore photoproduct lyase
MPWAPNYSHIYVEQEALDEPFTQDILQRLSKAKIVEIENYKQVFNRPAQNYHLQKQSPKLILAVKKDNFLYDGSAFVQNHQNPNFYYNALSLNCVYDCAYCYLQGMYNSANQALFVNLEKYFRSTDVAIQNRKDPAQPLYLCISYDTDLLGFESIAPYSRKWIEYAADKPDLLIELRTKSANFTAIEDIPANPSTILAWSLSPEIVAKQYEIKAPSLKARIKALQKALEAGWKVRICIDPILPVPDWQSVYREFIDSISGLLSSYTLLDIHLGVFRMNSGYFQNIRKRRPPKDLFYRNWEHKDGSVTHSEEEREALTNHVFTLLKNHYPADRIQVWES